MTDFRCEVRLCKALGDENRLQILEMLRNGERCACRILEDMNIQQSTLSHHMKILCDAGLVRGRRDGKWTHYALDPAGCRAARALLNALTTLPLEDIAPGIDRDPQC